MGFRDPNFLDTLAAAHAEAGNFNAALETAAMGLELARLTNQPGLMSMMGERMQQYRELRPIRTRPANQQK
jgi:hypothetical protein